MTILYLLLQIVEVHFDLGLEVPAPRPKSRLSLKRSRPPPPPVEVTPPPPPPRPISQRVLDIGKGLRKNWLQRVVDPRTIMPAPSYGPKFFPLRMVRIDVSIIFVGFFLAPVFCPHVTHGVKMTYFLQDYTGPWINPRHQKRCAIFTPRPGGYRY